MNNTVQVTGHYELECLSLSRPHRWIAKFVGLFSNESMTFYVRRFGTLKWSESVVNTVVSAGKAQLALLAGDATATPFTYLELGTSATAVTAGQTALQGAISDSGLARAAATVSRVTTSVTNDTLQLTYTWTASGTKTIEEIGVFNASSGPTMLSRALTGTKTVVNTDIFIGTYKVQFS